VKVLVIGVGSIGRRHIRNLRSVVPDCEIGVCRHRVGSLELGDVEGFVDKVFFELGEALQWRPKVALLTGPASLHVEQGLVMARAGVHLFIEKPLSDRLDRVDELIDLCHVNNLVLMVGYNLRFYSPLQALKRKLGRIGRVVGVRAEVGQYLPDWRPGADYRQGVSARGELGGGAVLELSHELDYVRWLVGEVSALSATVMKLGDLDIDVEDTAEIILHFANGAVGNVHLDMIQRATVRTCRVIGTEGTLEWDGGLHQVRLFTATEGEWTSIFSGDNFDSNQMFVDEIDHFIGCVGAGTEPVVTGEDGRQALEIALSVKRAAALEKQVALGVAV